MFACIILGVTDVTSDKDQNDDRGPGFLMQGFLSLRVENSLHHDLQDDRSNDTNVNGLLVESKLEIYDYTTLFAFTSKLVFSYAIAKTATACIYYQSYCTTIKYHFHYCNHTTIATPRRTTTGTEMTQTVD
jgi:hypothetical protein